MRPISICALLFASCSVSASGMWQAGSLDYADGSSEISAFVDIAGNTQLQLVLCSKNQSLKNRFTLLLPHEIDSYTIVEVTIKTGGAVSTAYGEAVGNSLDLQVDPNIIVALPDNPDLTLLFKDEDAKELGIPNVIDVTMAGAELTIKSVASECTALSLNHGYSAHESLISAILWPRTGFLIKDPYHLEYLCSKQSHSYSKEFDLTQGCQIALNRYYQRNGAGPLSFLYYLMHDENGSYLRYKSLWNEAMTEIAHLPLGSRIFVDDSDWYLLLYALINHSGLKDYPKSYYDIHNYKEDPTTLIYDIDSRYEMESLKYTSVLMRRIGTSGSAMDKINRALRHFNEFYRQFGTMLPHIKQAQALKPLIFRQMLMRLWRAAGMPQGLELKPEYAFIQGRGGVYSSNEVLERKCSYFEGARSDQFYLGSDQCVKTVLSSLRDRGFKTPAYKKVKSKYENFVRQWEKSVFNADGLDRTTLNSPMGLTLLTALRIYGFGDYFLLRECISTRDSDICSFESQRAYNSYIHELKNRVASISAVSQTDGRALSSLSLLWQDYHEALQDYTRELVDMGKIPLWRADLMLGIASVMQTDLLLNAGYYKEELPDESLLFDFSDVPDGSEFYVEDGRSGYKRRTELVELDKEHSK